MCNRSFEDAVPFYTALSLSLRFSSFTISLLALFTLLSSPLFPIFLSPFLSLFLSQSFSLSTFLSLSTLWTVFSQVHDHHNNKILDAPACLETANKRFRWANPLCLSSLKRKREKIVYGCRFRGIISSILFHLIMTPTTGAECRSLAAVPYCRVSCQTFRYFRLLPSMQVPLISGACFLSLYLSLYTFCPTIASTGPDDYGQLRALERDGQHTATNTDWVRQGREC